MIDPFYKQVYASVGVLTFYFSNGYLIGILSVILPDLRTSSIQLTLEQESWLPSILVLMLLPSQMLSGLFTSRLGRKYLFLVAFIPMSLSCFLLYYAQNFLALFLASLFAGLVGGGIAIGPMHVAESCSPKFRGIILNLKGSAFLLGLASVHFLSNFIHWRNLVMYVMIFIISGIFTTITTPESPAWFASKGRFEECKTSFVWFRGDADAAELKQLIECQEKAQKSENRLNSSYILNRSFLLAITINVSTVLFVEICGKQIFVTYVFDILKSMVSDTKHLYYYALIFDVVALLASIISCFIVRKFKRRMVIFSTGVPAVILLFAICALSFFFSQGILPNKYSWVTLVFFSMYFFVLEIGVLPACMIVMLETYPLSHRGIGVAISSAVFVGIMFTITKIAPSLLRTLGIHGTFFLSGVIISMSLLHLYYFLPETDRKTLQDIENELKSNTALKENTSLEAEEKMLC